MRSNKRHTLDALPKRCVRLCCNGRGCRTIRAAIAHPLRTCEAAFNYSAIFIGIPAFYIADAAPARRRRCFLTKYCRFNSQAPVARSALRLLRDADGVTPRLALLKGI
eukprot:3622554-Pleurochrysis_carterae.AAC.3